jgi:hypothetical protein
LIDTPTSKLTMSLTEKLALIALVVSCGSLLVSITGAVVAWKAKQQARQAATLGRRIDAINRLRDALSDLEENNVTCEVLENLRDAKALADVLFSPQVRSDLDHALKEAEHYGARPLPRTFKARDDMLQLESNLQTLIDRMKQEASMTSSLAESSSGTSIRSGF